MAAQEKTKMSRNKVAKPYWEMTAEQVGEATKEFDEEFVADKARPLTPRMRRRWRHLSRR